MPGIILEESDSQQASIRGTTCAEGSSWRCALTLPERFVIQLVSLMLLVRRGVLSFRRGRARIAIRKGDMTTSKTYARTELGPVCWNDARSDASRSRRVR